jgi:hypothetical protein
MTHDRPPRAPEAIIIGAMKGATTAMHDYLDPHPQISVAASKELHFCNGPAAALRAWPVRELSAVHARVGTDPEWRDARLSEDIHVAPVTTEVPDRLWTAFWELLECRR